MSSTNFLSATATQAGLEDGTISLSQILKDHHKRYQQKDDDIHAWVVTRHSQLLAEAEGMQADHDKAGNGMLLRGVTIGVKDIMSESSGSSWYMSLASATKDMPTKYGSKIYDNCNQPGLDASVVALCREQGAIILGKTVGVPRCF